ncbi:hypothetical protein BKA70DRAFT_1230116 [Coprinopsis sp. MPI-PUGE-AT-0042]|nr:hypothetical protein BKA70DRAFT_1230116 [Coprinopsis sp. MPI-PUGE-AT-0042]
MSNDHHTSASSKRSQARARTPRPEIPSASSGYSDPSDIPTIHPQSTGILYAAFIPPEQTLSNPPVIGFLVVSIPPVTATSTPAIERGISYGKFDEFPDVSPPVPGRNRNQAAKQRDPVLHMSRQDHSLRRDAFQCSNADVNLHQPRATFYKLFSNGQHKRTSHRLFRLPDSSGTSPIEPLTPEYASYLGSAGIQGLARLASLPSAAALDAAHRALLDFQTGGLAEIGRHVFEHLQRVASVEVDVWGRGEMRVKPHMSQSISHPDSEYPLLFSYPVPWEWYTTIINCRPPSLKQTPFSGEEELFPVDL